MIVIVCQPGGQASHIIDGFFKVAVSDLPLSIEVKYHKGIVFQTVYSHNIVNLGFLFFNFRKDDVHFAVVIGCVTILVKLKDVESGCAGTVILGVKIFIGVRENEVCHRGASGHFFLEYLCIHIQQVSEVTVVVLVKLFLGESLKPEILDAGNGRLNVEECCIIIIPVGLADYGCGPVRAEGKLGVVLTAFATFAAFAAFTAFTGLVLAVVAIVIPCMIGNIGDGDIALKGAKVVRRNSSKGDGGLCSVSNILSGNKLHGAGCNLFACLEGYFFIKFESRKFDGSLAFTCGAVSEGGRYVNGSGGAQGYGNVSFAIYKRLVGGKSGGGEGNKGLILRAGESQRCAHCRSKDRQYFFHFCLSFVRSLFQV